MTQLTTATDRRCESVAEPATLASRPPVTVGGLVPLSAIPHATTRDRAACHFTNLRAAAGRGANLLRPPAPPPAQRGADA